MKRRSLPFPDTLILLFILIALAQVATYLLPTGEYVRQGSRVVAGSYRQVDAPPLEVFTFLTAIPKGLRSAADVIFFVFIVGGVMGILRASGALDAMLNAAIRRLGGNTAVLIGGVLTVLALGSATIGMAEEYIAFVPLVVTMCLTLRLDAVVGVGLLLIGAAVGFGCAALNPFTVMIAQDIAGLPATSGQLYRWVVWLLAVVLGGGWLLRYARRIQRDPSQSLVADVDYSTGFEAPEVVDFTWQRRAIVGLIAAGIGLFVVGVRLWEWNLPELSAVFMAIAVLAAALARMTPNEGSRLFCSGAAELTTPALLIGFARTIEVVLHDGKVIDTVIDGMAGVLVGLPAWGAALGMLVVQAMINFLIPSGSGQAFVTMPIMAPLADVTGVSRQVAVLAYQYGDGFTNMLVPTNAVTMGMLALARVPYGRWLRFAGPLVLLLYALAAAALIVGVAIGYS
ncbi:MAG: YfcC family protein [Deltaproteobacteria bacterium]|jgi:uncharacterized ion transporter superfamily protein YfcC|nr:YfcC family protein [Deltaproteobacteria bacterium]MBW2535468.1 YfcC family protein [Deltaproteobacteria bacterium]